MNQAASHRADRKELHGATQNARLSWREKSGRKQAISTKSGSVVTGSLSIDTAGVPGQTPSPVLIEWFKMAFLEAAECAIQLSQVGGLGLNLSDSILDLLLCL